MILTGPEIARRRGTQIVIEPWDDKRLNPNSYNLCLHEEMMVYDLAPGQPLDMRAPAPTRSFKIPPEGLLLEPGRLYLGRTLEYTETRDLVPMLEGRSSVGRLGLFIHVTAGFGDVGFRGFWTLEITPIHPVRIYAGVEICQIFYHQVIGDIVEYKSGKYQNNKGIQPSLLYKELTK